MGRVRKGRFGSPGPVVSSKLKDTSDRSGFRDAIGICPIPFLDFSYETHFVSTVYPFFFVCREGARGVISAIRIVEQAIFSPAWVRSNLPKNGGLVLFGIPNVTNQRLENSGLRTEALCIFGIGYLFPALDFPLPHRNSCGLFSLVEHPNARQRCLYMRSPVGIKTLTKTLRTALLRASPAGSHDHYNKG